MNIATILKDVSKLNVAINDGTDRLPLSIITSNIDTLRSYLGQVLQYYREFSFDEINLISFKKDSTQLEVVVDSESKMIFLLFWVVVYNRKNIDNREKQITLFSTVLSLDYDILHVIDAYIIHEERLLDIMENISLFTE